MIYGREDQRHVGRFYFLQKMYRNLLHVSIGLLYFNIFSMSERKFRLRAQRLYNSIDTTVRNYPINFLSRYTFSFSRENHRQRMRSPFFFLHLFFFYRHRMLNIFSAQIICIANNVLIAEHKILHINFSYTHV